MHTEFEVKILDVDVDDILGRLKRIGARKVKERKMRRFVYDISPEKKNSWIRLRDDGEKNTLTIKEIEDDSISGTKELEIEVDDFDKTNQLLNKLGFFAKAYQENKRVSFKAEGVDVEIDSWPKIPTYIEIEGRSEKEVEDLVRMLGFGMEDVTSKSVTEIYLNYGIDITEFKELKF